MPTSSGGETRTEKLARLRTDLSRVRDTIARALNNGQTFNIGGTQVTQVAYEHAVRREQQLSQQVAALEASIEGRSPGGRALIRSKMA